MNLHRIPNADLIGSDAMRRLARRRSRAVHGFSALLLVPYFALMALFAFDKPLLGTVLHPGLTLWLVLGPVFIVAACLLGLGYVTWANLVFDPAAARLAEGIDLEVETGHDA